MLRRHGLENVRLAAVDGSLPYVIGEWMHAAAGAPTVLLYAHHDVQPPGIVANWDSDPSRPKSATAASTGAARPTTRPGRSPTRYAVGAWLATAGELPCNVRVLVEGEEEIGSPTLHAFLQPTSTSCSSDVLVLADAGNWDVGVPGLTYSLRGLAAADIELRALDGPQHSGMVGGAIPDPVMALARILASLVDEHGDPSLRGRVRRSARADRRGTAPDRRLRRPARRVRAHDGRAPRRASRRAIPRRRCTSGSGCARRSRSSGSTVIRSRARRTRSSPAPGPASRCGSVRVRMPTRCSRALRAHVEAQVPWGLELRFSALEGSPAWETDPTGPAFDAARRALHAGFGVEPVLMGVGGSIPFVGPFADAFGGIPALLMGPDDPKSRIHGENESLHLGDWQSLIRSEVHLLAALAARRQRTFGSAQRRNARHTVTAAPTSRAHHEQGALDVATRTTWRAPCASSTSM